jgi:hypothetical protein
MATTIDWFGGDGANQILPAESGDNDTLGFFGAGFGFSIRVGEYNNTCYVTNDNGTTSYGQTPNLRWANSSGAYVASETVATELLEVDNTEATLRITLNTDSDVQTQNSAFRAFDRVNIDNNPSGVTMLAAEINKPSPSVRGSGDTFWSNIAGSGSVLSLDDHLAASGTHQWYVGLTASPLTIGEKTNLGFYFETEFL